MMARRNRLCAVAAVSLWACAPNLPLAPRLPTDDVEFKTEVVSEPGGMAEDDSGPFRLMPGDLVDLKTLSKTAFDATGLLVDQGGGMHVPMVGRIAVAGLSLREAELAIEKEIVRFDRFAKVGLSLRDTGNRQAVVVGAVQRPSRVTVVPGVRVADLLAAGGGVRTVALEGEEFEVADLAAARLVRGQKPLPISVSRAMAGDTRHNVRVHPGDVLFVPKTRARRISVLGRVKAAKSVPYRAGMRLSEALAMAGGMDKGADAADIRVIRGPLSKPRVYLSNFKRLVDGSGHDVTLAAGDIVFVTTTGFATFAEVLQDLTPIIAAGGVAALLATAR